MFVYIDSLFFLTCIFNVMRNHANQIINIWANTNNDDDNDDKEIADDGNDQEMITKDRVLT